MDFLLPAYAWVKALHVVSLVLWMVGMLGLIRLYVYHAEESEALVRERFQAMELWVLRVVTNPAMIGAVVTGALMLGMIPSLNRQPWMMAKLTLAIGLMAVHGMASAWRKRLIAEPGYKPAGYFRLMSALSTLLMIGIVLMVVVRPWSR